VKRERREGRTEEIEIRRMRDKGEREEGREKWKERVKDRKEEKRKGESE
jgi:hypothetical protein